MAAKTFAAWSQKAKQKGINSSRAAYQGYLNNIGGTEPNAPAKLRAATTLQRKSAATSSSSKESKSYNVANKGFEGARANRRPIPDNRRKKSFIGGGQAAINADYENQERSSEGTPYYLVNVPEGQIIESQSSAGGAKRYGFVDDRGYVYWGSKVGARAYAGQYARTGSVNARTGGLFGNFSGEEAAAAAEEESSGGGGGSSGSGSKIGDRLRRAGSQLCWSFGKSGDRAAARLNL